MMSHTSNDTCTHTHSALSPFFVSLHHLVCSFVLHPRPFGGPPAVAGAEPTRNGGEAEALVVSPTVGKRYITEFHSTPEASLERSSLERCSLEKINRRTI